jgi:hypothetical protein
MFVKKDTEELKRLAQRYWAGYSSRSRLIGEKHDVQPDDFTALAFYEATLVLLNTKGLITQEALDKASLNFEPISKQEHY